MFWLAREHGSGGGSSSSLEEMVCVRACQAMALCVCRVKRGELEAHHGSLMYFLLYEQMDQILH